MTNVHAPTLAELVAANPATVRVFETFGLDYCCRGDRTLADACSAAGLDLSHVGAALAGLDVDDDRAWTDLDAASLAAHIVETHHRYLQEELPLLDALAAKVLAAHGLRHGELDDVRRLVAELRADLEPHLMKEERVLFPAIAALAAGQRDFPFGTVANPIRVMMMEHDRAGELLAELRRTSRGYTAPEDACASYRALYARLETLELDTHLHVHKENFVLFPAALRLAEDPARLPTGWRTTGRVGRDRDVGGAKPRKCRHNRRVSGRF
jgi:regulator of cell morphogenesis and NO signaling